MPGGLVMLCCVFASIFGQNHEEKIFEYTGYELLPFSQLAHGLSSGPITIMDNKTFFISNLHYDGKAPDAHFWAGKGSEPGRDGILVPDENGSLSPLPAYNGKNLTIALPKNLTVYDIDYFGMWCVRFAQNFGHVVMPMTLIQDAKPIQLPPFERLTHELHSGPILIIDDRTFFISSLYYEGRGEDVHFWIGNGSFPSSNGTLVPNEYDSSKSLSPYTGQSIYIRLPNDTSINTISYFGVWGITYKQNFGHVLIPKNLKIPPGRSNPQISSDNKTIIHVPKCCSLNQVLTQNGCALMNKPFSPRISVHEHNTTHLNNDPIETVQFVPFIDTITCQYQKYPLIPEEDRYSLLQNGSLMILSKHEILSQDRYCIETVDLSENTASTNWVTTPIVCFSSSEVPLAGTVFVIYASGVLLSAIFLIITALVFLTFKEVRDTRGKCVVGYAVSMAIAFICLASAQLSGINEGACTTLGFFIQFFLMSSFTWLSTLSWETYLKIRKYNTDEYIQDRKRLYYYVGIGVLVPFLILISTLVIDNIPAIPSTFFRPQFGKNSCWFDQKQWTMIYFYLPIASAIIFNIVLAALMKWNLVWLEKNRKEDIAWVSVKQDLKPMYRSCGFLLTLMALSWVMEIISFLVETDSGIWTAIDIINSLQGFLVFLIFVLHRPVKNKLSFLTLKFSKRKMKYDNSGEEELQLNGANGHDEFLTKLNRSESVEQIS